MSTVVDNLIAFKILYMLVQPFVETQAFKLGIIDAEGKNLRPYSSLKTSEEREAYTYLQRLVFNMKRIINKLPGGESRLKSIIAAMFLVKESYRNKERSSSLMEEKYITLLDLLETQNVTLAEEEITVRKFLKQLQEEGEGGAPVNNTSGASVTEPKIFPKSVKKYKKVARRNAPIEVGKF